MRHIIVKHCYSTQVSIFFPLEIACPKKLNPIKAILRNIGYNTAVYYDCKTGSIFMGKEIMPCIEPGKWRKASSPTCDGKCFSYLTTHHVTLAKLFSVLTIVIAFT